ncbi:MAG: hypothetical protein R3B84_06875 [Zavarzinella sp.]
MVAKSFLPPAKLKAIQQEVDNYESSVQFTGELVRRKLLTPYQQSQFLSEQHEKLLIGPYVILAPLGEGGMGIVYQAIQPRLDRMVALKVIRPVVLAAKPDILNRFHREAKAIANCTIRTS